MSEIDRLDDDIAALVRERRDPVPPPDAQARVAVRLSSSLGAAALAPSALASKASLAKSVGALGAALAIGAAIGSAITYGVMRTEPSGTRAVEPAPVIESADAGVPAALDAGAPAADAGSASSARTRPVPHTEDVSSDAAERNLVERARSALARGRFAQALQALETHRARYPDGRFAEEREALAIAALVGVGRRDEASARADRFYARYPRSLFRASIERSLREEP